MIMSEMKLPVCGEYINRLKYYNNNECILSIIHIGTRITEHFKYYL